MKVSTAPQENPWTSTATLDFNAGEYAGPYVPTKYTKSGAGGPITDVTHHRSVVFVKPDYWIITDRLRPKSADQPAAEHTYEQLFHFVPCKTEKDSKTISVWSATAGQPNLALIPVPDPELSVEIAEGRREPYPQGWCFGRKPQAHLVAPVPAPCVIYRKKAMTPAMFQTVLWPMKAGQTQRPRVERMGEPGDGAVKVTLPDGRVDWYRASSEPGDFELNGVSFQHSLAALVRLDPQGNVVAKEAVNPFRAKRSDPRQ